LAERYKSTEGKLSKNIPKYMLTNAEHSIRYAWFLLLLLSCSSNLNLSLFRHMIKQYHVNTTLF